METPNTRAGKLTEKVMEAVKRKRPMDTATYNAVYSRVIEALSLEFPPDSGVVRFPEGGGMFINRR